jgi:multicomponent Na+:H+ antiporter subunit E
MRRRVRAQEARVLRALHPDPETLLDPRRRREAQRRAAQGGLVTEAAAEARQQTDRPVEELRPDEGPQGPESPEEEMPR